MAKLFVEGRARLSGEVVAPPDKSISHRALIFAALGEGPCEIRPLSGGGDNRSTQRVLRDLGVKIEVDGDRAIVHGIGDPASFRPVDHHLDCGNSGTTMRMMSGVLAASRHTYSLTGDDSLQKRPMSRLLPLEEMGARISGREEGGKIYPPIRIEGGRLIGKRHDLKVASAQVKSAILLAGLFADGDTIVREPERSRDHTERMLRRLGVSIDEASDGALTIHRRTKPWSLDRWDVAPDPSSAAFVVAAALLTESPDLRVACSVNPTRTGFLDALRTMGADVCEEVYADVGGEPVAKVSVRPGGLHGAVIEGTLALRAIDELPLLAGVAAFAEGRTEIRDAGELRIKESDRIKATHDLLTAFGVRSTETPQGLIIEGGRPTAAVVSSVGDHRIAMTAAVMGLAISGTTVVHESEAIDVSFPGFSEMLTRLGARVRSQRG
jgi:3-phosphoshikimate 1-carboxyvinyltransferase